MLKPANRRAEPNGAAGIEGGWYVCVYKCSTYTYVHKETRSIERGTVSAQF